MKFSSFEDIGSRQQLAESVIPGISDVLVYAKEGATVIRHKNATKEFKRIAAKPWKPLNRREILYWVIKCAQEYRNEAHC